MERTLQQGISAGSFLSQCNSYAGNSERRQHAIFQAVETRARELMACEKGVHCPAVHFWSSPASFQPRWPGRSARGDPARAPAPPAPPAARPGTSTSASSLPASSREDWNARLTTFSPRIRRVGFPSGFRSRSSVVDLPRTRPLDRSLRTRGRARGLATRSPARRGRSCAARGAPRRRCAGAQPSSRRRTWGIRGLGGLRHACTRWFLMNPSCQDPAPVPHKSTSLFDENRVTLFQLCNKDAC